MEKESAPKRIGLFTQAGAVLIEPTYIAIRDGVMLLYARQDYRSGLYPTLDQHMRYVKTKIGSRIRTLSAIHPVFHMSR